MMIPQVVHDSEVHFEHSFGKVRMFELTLDQPSGVALAAATSAPTFAKRKNRSNLRKRAADETANEDEPAEEADAEDASVVRKIKQSRGEPLQFSTRSERPAGDNASLAGVLHEGSMAIGTGRDNHATAMLETETHIDRDGRALREKVLGAGGEGEKEGTYKGMTGYTDYRKGFRREQTVGAEKGAGAHGPLRANMYARVTTRIDYEPNLCKDYKETGFCSYGDSCKFMHDRGDYKQGWELEKDWEEEQKRKLEEKMRALDEDGAVEEEKAADDLPFACFSCRLPWPECKDPVVTRCKHYFCEGCALRNNSARQGGKCAVCGIPTQGIFNVATEIIKKMKSTAAV